jgi:hypothetical protein
MTIQTDEYLRRVREQSAASAPPPNTGFNSTAGDNVKSYVDRASSTLGTDPGATTEAGRLYAERVTNSLKTPDASSVSAQQTEDTNAARRAYLARMSADERTAQSGMPLGGAQATRIADQSQSEVNAANQAGQNAVNAYIRQRTEDNMNRAQGLETQQYGRVRDALGDARAQAATEYGQYRDKIGDTRYADETAYNRGEAAKDRAERLDQRNWEREQVIKGDSETAKQNLLSSLPDGPAKNVANQLLTQGKSPTEVLATVFNPDGSIKEEYRGKTPGALGVDAEREYALQTLQLEAEAKGTPFDPNSPEGVRAVAAKVVELRGAKNGPVTEETKIRTNEEAANRLASLKPGETPDPKDLETLPSINVSAIPIKPSHTQAWLAENQTGGWVRIGGEPYRVIRGANDIGGEAGDYVILQTPDGTERYIRRDGTISAEKPRKAVSKVSTSYSTSNYYRGAR